jgi:DNA-binding HxlR family transcriptional regulator
VVRRTVYPEIPARAEYMLTDLGRQLSTVVDELEVWGVRYMAAQKKQRNDGRG